MLNTNTSSYTIKCIKNDEGLREFEVHFIANEGVGKTDQEILDMCDTNNMGGFVTKHDDTYYVVTVWID